MTERTTIQVSKETKVKLQSLGEKRETMEDIIIRLLEEHEAGRDIVNMKTATLWQNGSFKFGTEYAGKTIRYIIEE